MKICFYANVPYSQLGKIEFYNNDLKILRELGHEVVVAERIIDLFKIKKVDLYYVWWWNRALIPIFLAKLWSAKVLVCGVFDYFLPYPSKNDYVSRSWWQKWLMRKSLALANANIFICQYEYDLVRRFFPVCNPHMVYLAVETDMYKEKCELPDEKLILNIAWSGMANAQRKGLFEIVRAVPAILERHPGARVVLAGREGDALPALKKLAEDLGVKDKIAFLGELSFEQKIHYMQAAWIYLQPSMYEGFGSAVAEAMACGTVSVCTAAGALLEVSNSPYGFLPSCTPENIAVSVNNILDKPAAEIRSAGLLGARYVRERFSYQNRKSHIERIVESVF